MSPAAALPSVAEFRAFLCDLDHWINSGSLRHVGSPPVMVRESLATDTWPDLVDSEFEDDQGRRNLLFVDTYHGTGGGWQQIE